jgi:hypothetical protein
MSVPVGDASQGHVFNASASRCSALLLRHVHQLPDVTVEVLEASAVHGAFVHGRLPRLPARDGFRDRLVDVLLAVGREAGSAVLAASAISPLMKFLKRSSTRSMTKMFSSMIMHAGLVVGELGVELETELGEAWWQRTVTASSGPPGPTWEVLTEPGRR